MKIEYISHACLLIEIGGVKIATDPWYAGPVYCDQWHVFPKPVSVDKLHDADLILISHGHEDHLHEPSLAPLAPGKRVFYPYFIYSGTREYLESMGFDTVTEAHSNRKYQLNRNTSVTYITNELDSIVILESNGKVIVNLNDALHASSDESIKIFTDIINKKYSNIDILFCGFGGASYYPNTFHLNDKDDIEICRLREQVFVHNFCKIVHNLQPKVAVPFAADFVLLSPDQRWINDLRFPRSKIRDYYETYFSPMDDHPVTIYDMYPGDMLYPDRLDPTSPYRHELKEGRLNHLIDIQYPRATSGLVTDAFLGEDDSAALGDAIEANIAERATLYDPAVLEKIHFSIEVLDIQEQNCFTIHFDHGQATITRVDQPGPECMLVLQTTSKVLHYCFGSEWGGDAICIGYGCNIYIHHKEMIRQGLYSVCINLLSREPRLSMGFKREPLRTALALWNNPGLRLRYKNRFLRRPVTNMIGSNRWLLDSKEQICQTFDLPVLNEEFSGSV